MELPQKPRLGIVGGGSWATAIAKILTETNDHINWFMRNIDTIKAFRELSHNPRYLCEVEFDLSKITFTDDINRLIGACDIIIFAIPSAFLKNVTANITVSLKNKVVVSAIKGLIPDDNLIIGEFFNMRFEVPLEQIAVISGPCHAEEIALERLSYLTFASNDLKMARSVAQTFDCHYVKTSISDDIYGTEYASVLKNIYAIAVGICVGLGYGDNFLAVLIANSAMEMSRFMEQTYPAERNTFASAYLGDLLVTSYSQFSRNRRFGLMIGKGYPVQSAQMEMNMVAEGYYASECITQINKKFDVKMPIAETVHRILYDSEKPGPLIAKLTGHLI